MHAGSTLIGIILIVIGALYLMPMFGINLIPIVLPTLGYPSIYVGGGLLIIGLILFIIGIKTGY